MPKFPDPPNPLATPATTTTLASGTRLWRIYPAAGRHLVAWNHFRFFGPTNSRFDHQDPPPKNQSKGILYTALDPTTCLAEFFQVTRIIDRSSGAPWLAALDTTGTIPLLDLTGTWPTLAGASMAINSGPRPCARKWSRAIYAAYPTLEGLLYSSSMHANRPSIALYERALSAPPAAPAFHRALSDPTLLPRLSAAANTLGYGLV
jgi:hypothetical protein